MKALRFDVSSLAIITSLFVAIKSLLLVVFFVIIERFSRHRTFLSLRSKTTLLAGIVIYGFFFFLFGNFEESPFIYFQF